MNRKHFSSRIVTVALILAMVFSMASPLTVLAETPEFVEVPITESATSEDMIEVPQASASETEIVQVIEPVEGQAPSEEITVIDEFDTYLGAITPTGLSSITVTPAGTTDKKAIDTVTALDYGDTFNIFLDWEIPNTITVHAGDTFTYQLPSVLDYAGDSTGTLKNGSNDVGTYKIEGGLVTLTYTKDMGSNIHGTLSLQGIVDKDGLGTDNGGNFDFNFPGIFDKNVLVNRNTGNDDLKVSKTMTPVNTSDKYVQNVVIAVDAKGPQPNVNVTDVMGDFLKYKDGTFAVYSNAACTTPYTNYTGSWDNITFPKLEDQTVYIKYQVDVDKKLSGYDQWNIDQNKNTVSAKTDGVDNNPGDDKSTVVSTVDETWKVDKNGNYDKTSGKATWTITIDPGNDTKIDGTKIKELLGADIGSPESITLKTTTRGTDFSGEGTSILGDWSKLVDGSYTLNGTNKKFQITIVTPLEDVPTTGQKNYTNKVDVTPYGDGQVKTGTGTIGVGEVFDALDKICETDSKSASTLAWKTTVNSPDTGLEAGAIVSDTVGDKHTLVYGTSGDGIKVQVRGGAILAAGVDYTIVNNNKDSKDPADTNSFTITFLKKIDANAKIDITYNTTVDSSTDCWPSNTAYLKATELGHDWKTETATHEYKVHIEKWGGNAEKGKFTWHAILKNFTPGDIATSTITVVDTLPDNNTYVEGSISVSELWGTTPYDGVTAAVSVVDGKPTVTFTVGGTALDALRAGKNINIQYNTILTNPAAVSGWTTYTNTVKAVVDGIDSRPVTATGSTGEPQVLEKTLFYDEDTAPLAKYVVDVNPAGLDLMPSSDTITLKDTMGTGLQLMANTVQVSADGGAHYTSIGDMGADYSLTYNSDTHEMALVVPDSTALKIKYSVLVTLEVGTDFTEANAGNKIELTGAGSYKNSTTKNLTGKVLKSKGTSTSEGNAVQIYKYEDGSISKALSGAHFKIEKIIVTPTPVAGTTAYTYASTEAVTGGDSLVSDTDGLTATVGGLGYDAIYRITETQAPTGFQVGDDYYFVFPGALGVDWEHSKVNVGGEDKNIIVSDNPTYLCNAYNKSMTVTDVSITKSWNDNGDADHKRPSKDSDVAKNMMTLYANGVAATSAPAPTITDNGNNTWTYTWSGLDEKDSAGNPITYTVKETQVPTDYAASTTAAVANGGTIVNTYPIPITTKVSIHITKKWVDNADADHKRPATTDTKAINMLTLLANGVESSDGNLTITNNGDNSWTYAWSDLPELATGVYTVKEKGINVPDGYTPSTDDAVADGGTITNTHLTSVSIYITKNWSDNGNAAGKRPASNSEDAKKMMTLYSDGVAQPDKVPTITDNGNNTWTYTWSGLSKQDSAAHIYIYTVKENTANAPANYTASTTSAVSNAGTITNTLDYGKISVTKLDAANVSIKLKDAVFGVFTTKADAEAATSSSTAEATITTNDLGVGTSANLPVGTYYVKELTAPSGYSLNTTVFEVIVTKGDTTPVKTGENAYVTDFVKAGQISVTKVDADDTTKMLAGAKFGVYKSEADANAATNAVTSITTYDSGKGTSIKLPIGTYYVKETTAPTGYDLNSKTFTVVVTEDTTVTVKDGANSYVTDTKSKGKLSITKVDADSTTTILAGAKFGVYTEAGASIPAMVGGNPVIITTSTAGNDLSPELPFGTYYVKEITAPDKYDLNTNTYSVNVTTGTTPVKADGKAYITDTKTKGQISVTKVDAESTSTILAGAEFGVFTDDKATVPAKVGGTDVTIVTTTAGNDVSVKLPIGTYYVKETKAPTGYDLNSKIFTVIVTKDATTAVKDGANSYVTDAKTKGQISVTKVDAESTSTILAGAEFGVFTDDKATVPANVGGTDVTIVTTTAGNDVSVKLPIGTYYVKETKAPTGYDLNSKIFTVVVTKDTTTAVKDVANNFVTDAKTKGQISVTKVDAGSTPTILAGAEFGVFTDDKATVPANVGGTDVTIVTTTAGNDVSVKLPIGTYYVKETKAPDGYIPDSTIYTVEVAKDATAVVTNNSSNTFGNTPTKVSVSKVAISGGNEIAGAKLKVIDEAGNVIDEWTSVENEKHEINGKLKPGKKYTLVEVSAPYGYEPAKDIDFTVSTDGSINHVEMIDVACLGAVTITKHSVNTDGEKLKGCSYVLFREKDNAKQFCKEVVNGCAVWTDKREEALVITTGDDGSATLTGLPMGDYFFLEVNPPAGHLIDETPIPVEITAANANSPSVATPVAQADPKVPESTTITPTPSQPESPNIGTIPQTSDVTPVGLLMLLALSALSVFGVLAIKKRKQNHNAN